MYIVAAVGTEEKQDCRDQSKEEDAKQSWGGLHPTL